jgi:hypothetical protein
MSFDSALHEEHNSLMSYLEGMPLDPIFMANSWEGAISYIFLREHLYGTNEGDSYTGLASIS